MLNFDDLHKSWNNLSKVQQFEILGFATALTTDNKTVPQSVREELSKRFEKYKSSQEKLTSWGAVYNRLLEELA